jgi:hypothetical protein
LAPFFEAERQWTVDPFLLYHVKHEMKSAPPAFIYLPDIAISPP